MQAMFTIYGRSGSFETSVSLPNTDEFNFNLMLTSSGTNIEILNRDCSKRIELFYSFKTTQPNELYNDKTYLIDCKYSFKVKLQPYDEYRNRLFVMMRINAEEINRSLDKRQVDQDFEDEEEIEEPKQEKIERLHAVPKKECNRNLKPMFSVRLAIKVEGGERKNYSLKPCNYAWTFLKHKLLCT
jgi:hypothetical protein